MFSWGNSFKQFRQVHAVHLVEFFFDLSIFFGIQKLSNSFLPSYFCPPSSLFFQVCKA